MAGLKAVVWLGSSKKDLVEFPEEVVNDIGHNLHEAQQGKMPRAAKVLRGFGGANVQEIVSNFITDTYRSIYTVEYEEAIYVLHCFQKKSKKGIETPRQEVDMIDRRLKLAREEHEKWQRQQSEKKKKM